MLFELSNLRWHRLQILVPQASAVVEQLISHATYTYVGVTVGVAGTEASSQKQRDVFHSSSEAGDDDVTHNWLHSSFRHCSMLVAHF